MRLGLAQCNPVVGQIEKNLEKVIDFACRAEEQKIDLLVFPELMLCGYPPLDLLYDQQLLAEMEKALEELIIQSASWKMTLIVGYARKNEGEGKPLFNSAAVIKEGSLLSCYDKSLLPTYDVFDERRYFEPGKGPLVCDIGGKRVAVLICEDIWLSHKTKALQGYTRDPLVELSFEKPEFLVNLSASPYHFQKPLKRLEVCAQAAKRLDCPVFLCCQVGANDEIIFDGQSLCVDRTGEVIGVAKGFVEELFVVDTEKKGQKLTHKSDPIQELYQALVLGVRDYFYKQGFTKAILGLSGGIDSALVACIAVEALGKENVLALMMPSRYSSESSCVDARALLHRLAIKSETISIERVFQTYLEEFSSFFKGKKEDVTEENIQARIRGMFLMALSNKFGYLVLNTSNKSELALGYSTLYGDMCGALAVIGDLLKTQVYELCRWVNRDEEVIARAIFEKAPSAELCYNQKDTDSLPVYEILDRIVQLYLEEGKPAREIAQEENLCLSLVEDIIKKIHLAEYKRRQAPPVLRVSPKALTVGRKVPIVQGWI